MFWAFFVLLKGIEGLAVGAEAPSFPVILQF
jgi:hypothetical protein